MRYILPQDLFPQPPSEGEDPTDLVAARQLGRRPRHGRGAAGRELSRHGRGAAGRDFPRRRLAGAGRGRGGRAGLGRHIGRPPAFLSALCLSAVATKNTR